MANIVNPLSNMSYTNKDFTSIYVELLDLVKKLTYKWDPSISNESDPGVILLKLNALIADKNNYNIDKNILEAFPLSVTQPTVARQLFEQIGYMMKWYFAGTALVSLKWIGDTSSEGVTYNIPRFTMVCDNEDSAIYTLTQAVSLKDDNLIQTCPALQGVVVEYTINNDPLINSSNLDSNNRIYFSDRNVAQNGIFINNEGFDNFAEWSAVDNLSVERLNQKIYKFGVDTTLELCYIEFPEDIDTLIGEGIRIHYIKTDGVNGNIARNVLSKFYSDVVIDNVELNADNVKLTNTSSVVNGYDPESIDTAYKNYKKTIGTFNTLITLRDYMNAISESKLVSNCVVCDRTTDIQSSYYIVTEQGELETKKLQIEDNDGEPAIDAFSLKMYLLQYIENPQDKSAYDQTFKLLDSLTPNAPVLAYIDELKSIQHDFIDLLADKICLFKNKYPVVCKIIPQKKLTELEINEVERNITSALYKQLNSKEVAFGIQVSYDEVYSIIMNADARIKAIILDDLTQSTFAVYYNNDAGHQTFEELDISNASADATVTAFRNEIFAKSVLAGKTQLLKPDLSFKYSLNQINSSSTTPVIEDIRAISTNTDIALFDTNTVGLTNSYKLKENENIQFLAPNLIDVIQYSSYVKYEYYDANDSSHTTTKIPKDTDYRLGAGESLVLYWKDTDDSEAYYTYYKYGEGTYLKSTFTINQTATQQSDFIGYSLPMGKGLISDDIIQAAITAMVTTDLSASKTITTRKINQQVINDANNYCYWILNKKVRIGNDYYYQLFGPSDNEYMLQEGEYFIFTDKTQSYLNILESGTRITRTCLNGASEATWQVKSNLDYSKIDSEGINAFTIDDWKVFQGASYTITTTEMQFITIPATYTISGTRTAATDYLIFDNVGAWSVIGTTPATLSHFSLSWSSADNTDLGTLPTITNASISWSGRSIFSVNTSTTSAQKLFSNQSIVWYNKDYDGTDPTTYGTIQGTGTDVTDCTYLLSNVVLNSLGGLMVDTTIISADGEVSYLKLYPYTLAALSSTTDITFTAEDYFDISFSQTPTATGYTITFRLPAGRYILPLENYNTNLSSVTATLTPTGGTDVVLYPINDSTVTNFKDSGVYYLLLNLTTGVEHTLKIDITRSSGTSIEHIRLYSIYKYSETSDISFNDVLAKVVELDVNKLYDYTYVVDSEIEISNPLIPSSYFDTNHIFNQFTINQISSVDVKVANRAL